VPAVLKQQKKDYVCKYKCVYIEILQTFGECLLINSKLKGCTTL